MAQLKVQWTHFAKQQRDEIFLYWNKRNRSNSYSKKLSATIKNRTDLLKSYPFSGKKISATETRILVLKNYSLIYFIKKENIYIISFWDNHQNPEKLKSILGL